jgi:TPR repeat protein
MNFDGDGIPLNAVEGLRWMKGAAQQGSDFALMVLAGRYRKGAGVQRDPVLAYVHAALAAERAPADVVDVARNFAVITKDVLSADQLKEANDLIKGWRTGDALPTSSKTGRK